MVTNLPNEFTTKISYFDALHENNKPINITLNENNMLDLNNTIITEATPVWQEWLDKSQVTISIIGKYAIVSLKKMKTLIKRLYKIYLRI